MATTKQSFKQELAAYNAALDENLKGYRMTLRLFKTIKALTQLVGATAGIYAMHLGADPLDALILTSVIISGPEVLEFIISESGAEE